MRHLIGWLLLGFAQAAWSAALPDERADVMYHYYEGGGQKVQGPALLVRKNFAEKASLSAGYYVDEISGASIDVITNASPYDERREEVSASADYLYRDAVMSLGYVTSSESDYDASTIDMAVAQDMFGNMTTLTLGYTLGSDTVGRVDTDFEEERTRNGYRVSVAQVLTRSMIGTFTYEGIADEGYLQNPYRSARVLGASVPEVYPETLTSNAFGLQLLKSWPGRWVTRLGFRYYDDTWQVQGNSLTLGFTKPIFNGLILDARYRYYSQTAASFYSDNFEQPLTYMARDKELSTFTSHTVGYKLTAPIIDRPFGFIRRGTLTISTDILRFEYDDFTDLRSGDPYSFDAGVLQLYVSAFY